MKKTILLFSIITLLGCNNDDETKFYTFSGQVLQYPDLNPAANANITLSTSAHRDQFPGSYELRNAKTDGEGRYEFQIPAKEFSTSLFLFENHPSYTINVEKSGYLQLPNFNIRVLFPGNPINPGEPIGQPITGQPLNPLDSPPADYFEKEIRLGREAFLSLSAEKLDENVDSVYLIIYRLVPDNDDPTQEVNSFDRSYVFKDNFETSQPINGFPLPYALNLFPMDTTLLVPMSLDPHNKLTVSWTQYFEADSLQLNKIINLSVGNTVDVFE